jgi:hypothetical protein
MAITLASFVVLWSPNQLKQSVVMGTLDMRARSTRMELRRVASEWMETGARVGARVGAMAMGST